MTASFTINLMKNTLCSSIKSHGISGITEAHIHTGAAGVDGPDVISFDPKKIGVMGSTCVPVAAKLLTDITMNPATYFFNAHTAKFPDSAVRGQLKMAG